MFSRASVTSALAALLLCPLAAHPAQERFYLGTYSRDGIYTGTIDSETGKLSPVTIAAPANNAGYLAFSPDASHLYAVTYDDGGSVAAYKVGTDGALTFLNKVPVQAPGGCYLSVDPSGKNVLVANYDSGTIVSNKINPDGSLGDHTQTVAFKGSGPDPARQDHPYAHFITADSSDHFIYACDLGTDHVWAYHFDPGTGKFLDPVALQGKVPAGSGPRHLVFGPGQNFAYVNGEMGRNVTVFTHYKATGDLLPLQSEPLFPGAVPSAAIRTAEIVIHPSGKWLYVSSRGDDIISQFGIGSDGRITFVQEVPALVKEPRGFGVDPAGRWLISAGQNDSQIAVLAIAQDTGKLTPAGDKAAVPSPVDVLFAPKL